MDAGLRHLADLIIREGGPDLRDLPGAGAAGGLGGGLLAFTGATLKPGADLVLDLVGFREAIRGAHLVLTGEGRLDGSTANNKAPAAVAKRCKAVRVPCIALAGGVGPGVEALYPLGVNAVFALTNRPMTLQDAMADAETLLEVATEQVLRTITVGMRFGIVR